MNWNDLDMSQKAQWIKFFVDRNIVDLNDMRSLYNQFAEGGPLYSGEASNNTLPNGKYGLKDLKDLKEEEVTYPGYVLPVVEIEGDKLKFYNDVIRKWPNDPPLQPVYPEFYALTSLPSIIAQGGWQALWALRNTPFFKKAAFKTIRTKLAKNIARANTIDTAGDVVSFIEDPNIMNGIDLATSFLPAKDLTKPAGQAIMTARNLSNVANTVSSVHSLGGPLPKPFSYSPIPAVRYAEGGLFSTNENQLILPTIFDWENSGIAERERFQPGYSLDEVTIEAPAVLKELPEFDLSENDYLNNQYKIDMLNEVKKLKGDLLKEVQRDLADKGYYDIDTSRMTVQQIKALLRRIGTEDDGIWGKKSIAKWRDYNVDGKYGRRTQEAFLNSKDTNGKWDRDVSTADTEWCALWVHKKAVDASGLDNLGVRGDAWRMPLNIVNKGGLEVFNIYKRKEFSKINGVQDLKYKTRKALLANPFDISLLKIGDVVGIYMPSSDMHKKALATGTTYNTHVGIVTGFNSEGKPIVEHNIHRSHRKDPADRLTGSKEGRAMIATVSRPNYSQGAPVLEIQNVDSKYKAEDDSPLFKQFADNIAGSKDIMRKIFPGADVDEIERISLAVLGRETGFMKNKKSDLTGYSKLKSDVADIYRDKVLRKDKADISSNLSKLKFSSFSDYERKILGINTPEDLEDPNIAGKAVMYYMSKNWDYFKRMQEEYPLLGMTDDDVRYLTELSYNQGMSKLKNIGFKEGGIGAPEELEAIRKMADKDAKIRDITSTNYKHMGKVGEILYEIKGRKGFTPYISSAEKYRQSLIDRLNKED